MKYAIVTAQRIAIFKVHPILVLAEHKCRGGLATSGCGSADYVAGVARLIM
jgi:hypothetical protein